ncbi:uncharacterized protein BT62DRAFT_585105 [Guyanagaster necrorhizus]|uniref:Uncharacterized protein n=1 Tax=Guyanagaster necrorhizus TaxID=856835 RepID=A0A9P7VHI1_9AGAR|nr:uncharacterized protein BT62DRAFT_585105 [Guyanagaster necrorhizus MCA 3950]KAG7440475.1 hypothetical protein BT62DRAFT_585105 [Guyanagaster necrorhizus MCA 3950]
MVRVLLIYLSLDDAAATAAPLDVILYCLRTWYKEFCDSLFLLPSRVSTANLRYSLGRPLFSASPITSVLYRDAVIESRRSTHAGCHFLRWGQRRYGSLGGPTHLAPSLPFESILAVSSPVSMFTAPTAGNPPGSAISSTPRPFLTGVIPFKIFLLRFRCVSCRDALPSAVCGTCFRSVDSRSLRLSFGHTVWNQIGHVREVKALLRRWWRHLMFVFEMLVWLVGGCEGILSSSRYGVGLYIIWDIFAATGYFD